MNMSFLDDRSYRAGKYGEDETGSRARARREAKQNAKYKNIYARYDEADISDLVAAGVIPAAPPPPPVIPDMESWLDDVSAITGLTTSFRSVGNKIQEPAFGSFDEQDKEDSVSGKPATVKPFVNGRMSLYPDISEINQTLNDTEHSHMSKLSAAALKQFEEDKQKLDAEADEELAKLALELNMEYQVIPSSSKARTIREQIARENEHSYTLRL